MTLIFPTLLVAAAAAPSTRLLSILCADPTDRRSCRLQDGHHPAAAVVASYDPSTNLTSGFSTLEVAAGEARNEELVMVAYAAGLAEGYHTAADIALFYENVYEFGPDGPSKKLVQFVLDNDNYTRSLAAANAETDDYWMAVALVLARFDGTLAGYQKAQETQPSKGLPKLSKLDLLWINLDGDLFDLQVAVGEAGGRDRFVGRGGRAARLLGDDRQNDRVLRCSSLFKLTDDRRDLLFGHATWDTYATAAPRIFKHLTLPTRRDGLVAMRTISMSSSPGFMSSIDDYYLVGEKGTGGTRDITLGVIETSISIDDVSAYKAVTPRSVLCWIRSMAANQLAVDAPSWAKTFEVQKSGTYNNQWLILDVAKAAISTAAGEPLAPDVFWVLEEVPGLIHAEDQSQHLNLAGYWPSFNEIFYKDARKVAGAQGSYEGAMRYRLFHELQGNVTTNAAMARVIAWNDYQRDPIARGPSDAIMSRGDLGGGGRAGGGIDAKYSSVALASSGLASFGRAGPTDDDQPPFCWTSEFGGTPHAGHPRCFRFGWEQFRPQRPYDQSTSVVI